MRSLIFQCGDLTAAAPGLMVPNGKSVFGEPVLSPVFERANFTRRVTLEYGLGLLTRQILEQSTPPAGGIAFRSSTAVLCVSRSALHGVR
jgi:hypothetical protein